jgi:mRNA-degrading endonuclease toxin of MazEF toxin-antitoxin module
LIDQIRTIDKRRIVKTGGNLNQKGEVNRVKEGIQETLAD